MFLQFFFKNEKNSRARQTSDKKHTNSFFQKNFETLIENFETRTDFCLLSFEADFGSDVIKRQLRHRRAPHGRRPHLRQDAVEPLQRSVEVKFDPTWRRRDRLSAVLGAPALDEAHSDGAHPEK